MIKRKKREGVCVCERERERKKQADGSSRNDTCLEVGWRQQGSLTERGTLSTIDLLVLI